MEDDGFSSYLDIQLLRISEIVMKCPSKRL